MATGQPSRDEMLKMLGKPVPNVKPQSSSLPSSKALESWMNSQSVPVSRKKDSNPIFDIPILGPVLDFIDTPRAAIVSGIKEFGDIFDDDESFSIGEWADQTRNNIFMGEVLRDWGVDLPGPLDFALGLGLDIAFDPLTYMLPMGAWARMANKNKVADNLFGAAAKFAKSDPAKAEMLEKAASRVMARGSYAAGKEALEEIGLSTAVRFSVPLSGRLGQAVFERPLRMIPGVNAKWGKWMDARRVKQLGQVNVGPGGKWVVRDIDTYRTGVKRGFDISNPNNQQKVLNQVLKLNSANGQARKKIQAQLRIKQASSTTPQLAEAALTAARMPVEMGFKINRGFGTLALVAGVPGKIMGQASKYSLFETIGKGLSTNYEINQLWRSGDPTKVNTARWMEAITNRAMAKGATLQTKHMGELAAMGQEARALGIDFDTIFRAANERMGSTFAAAIDPRFGPRATGGQKAAKDLVGRLNQWFDDILEDYNNALPYRENLEGLASELYVTRQMAKENLELIPGKTWVGEGSGLTGSPFKNRELHLPDSVLEAYSANKIADTEVARIKALFPEFDNFEDILKAGKGIEVRTTDGQIYRTKFMGRGFKMEAEGGSVLTQMDEIGIDVLGKDYKQLFTDDAAAALTRYLEQMIGQIRGQAIVDDLAQHGIIFKATDQGVVNAAGRKILRDINNQVAKRDKKLRNKVASEKKTLAYADTIANYNPEEALEVVETIREASRGAPRIKTGKPGGGRVKPEIDLPTSYPPRSMEQIYDSLAKNQKGKAGIREMMDDPLVAEYAANVSDLETVNEVIVSVLRGDASNVTEKGRLLLAQGIEALPHPSGRFSPNVRPLVPPEGTPYQVHADRLILATDEDIRSAEEFLDVLREEQSIINKAIAQLQTNFQGLEDIPGMRANFVELQEFAQENIDFINSITSNFVRNVLENLTSVQAAEFMEQLGRGSFGDITLFSTRKVSPLAEEALDVQNRWVKRLEQKVVNAQTIDLDVGSGGIPMEWWEAYKAANPNWQSVDIVRPSISGRKVVLKNVGEKQMERFQQFTDDWLAQKGGSPPPRKPVQKVAEEPPNWSSALNMAENWPAQYVDDVVEAISRELASEGDAVVKFSTGPRSGKGQSVRPTDGALREYRGSDFTISKGSGSEWQVVVDGQAIPISGPRARVNVDGEGGLVLWLQNQRRLIRFNPSPRQASMATGVTPSKSKQALAVAKRISARIDDAAAQRLRNVEYQEGLRDEALLKREEWRVKAEARVQRKVNVFEEYRLAQYGKRTLPADENGRRTIIGSREFAPQPVGRQTITGRKWFIEPRRIGYGRINVELPAESWTGRVVDQVEVRIPAREGPALTPPKVPPKDPRNPAPVTGEAATRLKDGSYVVDTPWGRLRLNPDQAAAYDAARSRLDTLRQQGTMGRDDVGGSGRAATVERSGTTEVKDVFAVNVYTDEMLVYKNPRKGRWVDRYVEVGATPGPNPEKTFVSGEGQPLMYVKPAPDDVRMQSSLEGGLWDVVDPRPGRGFSPDRLRLTDNYSFKPPGRQFKSRLQSRGWVFLDDVDAVKALEDGTYVVPPIRSLRGTTIAEKEAIERVFNDPLYRGWVKRVQEATRLEQELGVQAKLRYGTINSTMAAKEEMILRHKQATQDAVNAKINALEDQIELGVTGPSYAIGGSKSPTAAQGVEHNRRVVAALRKRAESLDSMTEEGLLRMDQIRQHLATIVPPYRNARKGLTDLGSDEKSLAIVNAHYVEESNVLRQMQLEYEDVLTQAQGNTVKAMDVAESQADALKVLQEARVNAGFTSAYDELIQDYVTNAISLGKNAEKSSGISSRTRQHLNGYMLSEAGDETVELFEAAFQSAAKLRDPVEFKWFGKRYRQFQNYWKAQAVATSGFVFRNMLGGTWINNQIAGVPISTQIRVDQMRQIALKRAAEAGRKGDVAWGAREIAKEGKATPIYGKMRSASPEEWHVFSMWSESGMANTGITSMEVASAVTEAGRGVLEAGTIKPWSRDFYLFGAIGKFNQRAEFSLRGGLAHHIMMNGGSREEALSQIYKYHFDYSNLTNWDQRIKMVIPFWTWQKNILPVLIESFGTRPQAWGRLVQVKGELELTSEEEGVVPHYFGENMGIRLPFTAGGNRVYALPDLPFKDLARYLKEPTSPARGLVESALPFYKLPIELWAGKRTFADIPFTGRYQQVPHSIRLLPGLMPFLSMWGKAQKNAAGEWKMRDQDIYVFEQIMPIIGRARRLVPNENDKQERLITTYASFLFGLGLRTNTPQAKRGQMIQDQIKHSQDARDALDLIGRNV
tara:strand:+ start:5620 stop:12501 length:6882 start_codon:yes stop_codon:yes gene_type:complete